MHGRLRLNEGEKFTGHTVSGVKVTYFKLPFKTGIVIRGVGYQLQNKHTAVSRGRVGTVQTGRAGVGRWYRETGTLTLLSRPGSYGR